MNALPPLRPKLAETIVASDGDVHPRNILMCD
jgi:hypothetical protein